jgi:hypothetical protein
MRRSIFCCLAFLLSAEVAHAQAKAGYIASPVWGGGRNITTPPNADSSHPDQSGNHSNSPPAFAHGGHGHTQWHRHGRYPWNNGWGWNRGWGWNWYLPPVFVAPSYSQFGFTYSLPYATPGISVPAAPPRDIAPIVDPPAPADPAPPTRVSNPDQKAKAGRYLGYGDALFAKQKYLAAIGRYKSASEAAADVPESYLRQGFAYVALGKYEHAAKVFRRGLAIRPNWQGSAFRLSMLYDGAEAAKMQDLEKLALAVEDNPFDSGLLLSLGMMLFFDGQFDRADLCFQNAARLGGSDEALIADFLPGAAGAGAAAPAKPRKVSF